MNGKFLNISVVAEVQTADGHITLVDVAVRDRDLPAEVVLLLLEKANSGVHHPIGLPLHPDFDPSDALGG